MTIHIEKHDVLIKEKVQLKDLKIIYVDSAIKAIQFLTELSVNLEKLEYSEECEFVIEPGKVSYYDILTEKYKLYDFTKFNSVMSSTYYYYIIKPKIQQSQLFWYMKLYMDIIYDRSKKQFYHNIFNTFHLVSWFLKTLRISKENINTFCIDKFLNNFPIPFLDEPIDLIENINFVIGFINILHKNNIIKIFDNKMDFNHYNNDLNNLINFSFEQLVFGGNLNIDKYILIPKNIDITLLNDKDVLEDYKFNYIVSFATNYVTYDNCSNNLFIENFKWRA